MIPDTLLNDSPIATPEADAYGLDAFAAALARGIARMSAPEGFVIALDGSWGSGKSSVVNLLLHHLRNDTPEGRMEILAFSPWWFAGAEAMTRGFFETLADTVQGSLKGRTRRKAKEAMQAVYDRVRPAKPFASVAGDAVAGAVPLGSTAVALADAAMDRLGAKRPLAEEYARLADALRGQDRRTLVVVDDIDRLDPDDAMLVFQLVKSVGRLPNVLYLLAFDGTVAARHLERRFGAAGADYLDKVVQATYGLPVPDRSQLLAALLAAVSPIFGAAGPSRNLTRFGNHMHDCAAPWLRTPRDVVRLVNAITVGWPAVAGEADAADFLALEAIKLSHPGVHRAIQRSASRLCGLENLDFRQRRSDADRAAEYDELLLSEVAEADRVGLRIALRRLFPRLDGVYANTFYSGDRGSGWLRDRLVCSAPHFATYFRLSPSREVLSSSEVATLLAALSDAPQLRGLFLAAVGERRGSSRVTQASLLLEELRLRVEDIPAASLQPMLGALFEVADDIDSREDNIRGFPGWGNQLRLWWLLRELLPRHLDQDGRSTLLLSIIQHAQVGWSCYLAEIAWDEHHPTEPAKEVPLDERLVTLDGAVGLRASALEAIRRSATTGELIAHPSLRSLLFAWKRLAEDEGRQVRRWTRARLEEDRSVLKFAETFISYGETYALGGLGSLGDRVATRIPQVDRRALARVCDIAHLDERAATLLAEGVSPENEAILKQFLETRKPEPTGPDQP
ncbi:P-loop NTPase fold protein [Pararoseomonas sp. SCSIO 73927]|uniref:KAP family P-loop NTPase fold protein n=1 Tax=Pararoseomonas sp. SCSIO 73927 TaxID=3114537 RepID=UPI0030D494FE